MDIRSILVNVDLNAADSTSLKYAIDLARRFDAELIGLAADEPNLTVAGMDAGAAAADFYSMQRTDIEKQLVVAEKQFRALVPAGIKSQWFAFVDNPIRALIDRARIADLIVTGATVSATFRPPRKVDLGELVLGSGRPVIDVADGLTDAKTDKIMIGWKDTREARRAVVDALPFLRLAKNVRAITVSEGDTGLERNKLDDLLAWLARHDVKADGEVLSNAEGFVDVLESTARAYQADLLVAGGYGHSRLREWLLGGVTRNLLEANTLTRLLSN